MTIEEIRKGAPPEATHIDHIGYYWDLPNSLIWIDNKWQKDNTGFARIWYPL